VPVPDLLPEARFRHPSPPAKSGEEINLELLCLNSLPDDQFRNGALFFCEKPRAYWVCWQPIAFTMD
jgi:hypothetical protein